MEPIIHEFSIVQNALNDIVIRAQQCLIAIDIYEKQLTKVDEALPGLRTTAMDAKDYPFNWTAPKTPKDLIDYQKKSRQYILLNGWNLSVCLLDDFMKMIAVKYWNLKVPRTADGRADETWFTPDGFELVTGIKISVFNQSDMVDTIRRDVGKLRLFRKTQAITVSDFFDGLNQIGAYIYGLAQEATRKAIDDRNNQAKSDGGEASGGSGPDGGNGPSNEPDDDDGFDSIE